MKNAPKPRPGCFPSRTPGHDAETGLDLSGIDLSVPDGRDEVGELQEPGDRRVDHGHMTDAAEKPRPRSSWMMFQNSLLPQCCSVKSIKTCTLPMLGRPTPS